MLPPKSIILCHELPVDETVFEYFAWNGLTGSKFPCIPLFYYYPDGGFTFQRLRVPSPGPNVADVSRILRSTTNPPRTSRSRPSVGSPHSPALGVALWALTWARRRPRAATERALWRGTARDGDAARSGLSSGTLQSGRPDLSARVAQAAAHTRALSEAPGELSRRTTRRLSGSATSVCAARVRAAALALSRPRIGCSRCAFPLPARRGLRAKTRSGGRSFQWARFALAVWALF